MHLAVLHRIFQQNLPWCNHGRTVDHIRFLQLCKCDFLRGMHDCLLSGFRPASSAHGRYCKDRLLSVPEAPPVFSVFPVQTGHPHLKMQYIFRLPPARPGFLTPRLHYFLHSAAPRMEISAVCAACTSNHACTHATESSVEQSSTSITSCTYSCATAEASASHIYCLAL